MNIATLNEICAVYQPTFTSMEYYTAKSSSIFSTTNDVVETLHSLPEAFLEEYVPIYIPRDGNCLFHAISQFLNGSLNVTRYFCLLAVSVFISNIAMFHSIIHQDRVHTRNRTTVEQFFENTVFTENIINILLKHLAEKGISPGGIRTRRLSFAGRAP